MPESESKMPRPADFFIGLVDFFAILLPGALLSFLVLTIHVPLSQFDVPDMHGEAAFWVKFAVGSYLLGQLVFAVSPYLDRVYDRFYAPYQRSKDSIRDVALLKARALSARTQSRKSDVIGEATGEDVSGGGTPSAQRVPLSELQRGEMRPSTLALIGPTIAFFWERLADAVQSLHKETEKRPPKDPLKDRAQALVDAHLGASRTPLTRERLGAIGSVGGTLRWAEAIVKEQSAVAAQEIDRLEADSKFFRGLTTVLLIYFLSLVVRSPGIALICLFFMGISFWRFCKQRWKRTQFTYIHFIALSSGDLPARATVEPARRED
jgi:hypothetical protein